MDTPFVPVTASHINYLVKFLPHLCFEVTEACNLHCAYCAFSDLYTKNEGRNGKSLSYKTVVQLLDYLWCIWGQDDVKEIPSRLNISFYGGEPLLNIHLIQDIVAYAEKNASRINRHITYSMTTNAVLLPDYIDFFSAKDFNLLVSLDGDEYGDSYRVDHHGNPSFHTVFRAIKKIANEYPVYFEKHISFNAVLNNRNDYPRILLFFKEHFNKVPTISPLSTSNLNSSELQRFCSILNTDAKECDCEASEISPSRHAFLKEFEMKSGNAFYDYDELLFDKGKRKLFATGTCLPFMKKLFLTANGDITQCEKIDHRYTLGHVGENGVELDYEAIAKAHNEKIFAREELCRSCKIHHYCSRCVYLETEPGCYRYKDTLPQEIDSQLHIRDLSETMAWVYSTKTVR